ncbi:MAG: 30S ribosomal protein S9, small subunit ribosomal protein S9 [Candidatus Peregrinibacteria bacterium GW2011_GWF2_33_10]|nr:MAG: 30S ribosomal protein S9, small subunit ribosomal protein S9 [Candidatus Peregrinibacteria bacterium GW2011_GWF2_33_10]OGJ46109.1 MAG: 30S ribosomal protein S9 [Candidatus Peregrinibacteria bacterium RIFOXYA12_FULL_33_12]OGJ46186.1 MAG: 30S ribosomal protein S9 [Candidatus Peregrinibacteria bacterium RIFOXYA2_FULL_33_21]OGJ51602.1 MAG: 30S ribosomal protein S9 [Candidatus Peregrinibacteria bacterium RIFOXYB2_FULL_33_20]
MAIKNVQKEESVKEVFKGEYVYANGKRKTSIAQVRLYKGNGRIIINDRDISEYVKVKELENTIRSPFLLTNTLNKFDLSVMVRGGGSTGQAEAIRHGVSRALVSFDAELRPTLKKAGYLMRDPRAKERKKPGLKRARRAPQWNKR